MAYQKHPSYIEANRQDLEAARRLAPRNPMIALNLARLYREDLDRPDLAAKLLAGATGGTKATRALIVQERSLADAAVEAKAKTGG